MGLEISMHEFAKVKLTKFGIKLLQEKLDEEITYLNRNIEERYLKSKKSLHKKYSVDEEGYCYLRLYEIMNIFGKYSEGIMPNEQPFEDFILIFSTEKH